MPMKTDKRDRIAQHDEAEQAVVEDSIHIEPHVVPTRRLFVVPNVVDPVVPDVTAV